MLQISVGKFSFIDAGCGNGWVVRNVSKMSNCVTAVGIDGAENMILKAKGEDPLNHYFCDNLMNWTPNEKVDIVHSMEVFILFTKSTKTDKTHLQELVKRECTFNYWN